MHSASLLLPGTKNYVTLKTKNKIRPTAADGFLKGSSSMRLGISSYCLCPNLRDGKMTIFDVIRWAADHDGHAEWQPLVDAAAHTGLPAGVGAL